MISQDIQKALGESIEAAEYEKPREILLEFPRELSHGDFATNVALILGKQQGVNPLEIAESIVKNLPTIEGVDRAEVVAPGFINFFIDDAYLKSIISTASNNPEEWGRGDALEGKKYLIEHSSPNLFKTFHIGHLVNNAVGETLVRLTASQGAQVTAISWPSDVSPGIAKAVWGLMDLGLTEDVTIENIGKAYTHGVNAYKEDSEAKEKIDSINKELYEGTKGEAYKLYKKGRDVSLENFQKITSRLGSQFADLLFESQSEKIGKEIVQKHCPGVFEESEGAIIYRGTQDGLYDSVFINGQGFGTYLTKDLGLIKQKKDTFDFDYSLTITDAEQKQHFQLVLSAAEKIMPDVRESVAYVHHGRLSLTEGKISSRLGNAPLIADLIAEIKTAVQETSQEDIDDTTLENIAIAALKYTILRTSLGKNITFDPRVSLSLEGDSFFYLQYTHARTVSLLQKGAEQSFTPSTPTELPNIEVARLLARFPYIVERAALEQEPHHVTQYLITLSAAFNAWYAAERILDGEHPEERLCLVAAVGATLRQGMYLLGVTAVSHI